MKEKTFEELIAEQFRNHSLETQKKIAEFGKQVRKATIEECKLISENECLIHDWEEIYKNIETNRIIVEK